MAGESNGPVWTQSDGFDAYMSTLKEKKTDNLSGNASGTKSNATFRIGGFAGNTFATQENEYWLPKLADKGKVILFSFGNYHVQVLTICHRHRLQGTITSFIATCLIMALIIPASLVPKKQSMRLS